MRSMRAATRLLAMALSLGLAGCATSFSPERVRSEIAAQTGGEPQYVFEIQLGRVTMHMIRTALAGGGNSLPLAGLTEFDLAFYDVPSPSAHGVSLDFTKMSIRGWESVVRTRQPGRSALVLVREGSATLDDLVLLGAAGPAFSLRRSCAAPIQPRSPCRT